MSILQFYNKKTKQDLSKRVYVVVFTSTLFKQVKGNKSNNYLHIKRDKKY